jgi:hypothetical protein
VVAAKRTAELAPPVKRWETVPTVEAPFMKVAVSVWFNRIGSVSASNPNVLIGVEKVMFRVHVPQVRFTSSCITWGVLLSTAGGLFQVNQPIGTGWRDMNRLPASGEENDTVNPFAESEPTRVFAGQGSPGFPVALHAGWLMGSNVVEFTYPLLGSGICMNAACAGTEVEAHANRAKIEGTTDFFKAHPPWC